MPPHLFCFGFGYSAQALAANLLGQGWQVSGTSRGAAPKGEQQASGAMLYGFSGEEQGAAGSDELLSALATADHLLISIPPAVTGDPVLAAFGGHIAANRALAWVGYLSTTGVYGNHDGAWVTEDSPLRPTSDRSRWRQAAEDAWLDCWRQHDCPLHIFRLAGIYGPGRNALETVLSGKAKRIDVPGQVFGRIHVEDIAAVLAASIAQPNPGRVYNVSDDLPAAPAEVVAYACDLLGKAPPPLQSLEAAGLSPMGRSFYADNKRVANDRLHAELGVRFRYPDYRAGLTALAAALKPKT